jgi:hypothetical protein
MPRTCFAVNQGCLSDLSANLYTDVFNLGITPAELWLPGMTVNLCQYQWWYPKQVANKAMPLTKANFKKGARLTIVLSERYIIDLLRNGYGVDISRIRVACTHLKPVTTEMERKGVSVKIVIRRWVLRTIFVRNKSRESFIDFQVEKHMLEADEAQWIELGLQLEKDWEIN